MASKSIWDRSIPSRDAVSLTSSMDTTSAMPAVLGVLETRYPAQKTKTERSEKVECSHYACKRVYSLSEQFVSRLPP